MSNYSFKAKHKETGKIVEFNAYDNFFGWRQYGYSVKGDSDVMTIDEFDETYEIIS